MIGLELIHQMRKIKPALQATRAHEEGRSYPGSLPPPTRRAWASWIVSRRLPSQKCPILNQIFAWCKMGQIHLLGVAQKIRRYHCDGDGQLSHNVCQKVRICNVVVKVPLGLGLIRAGRQVFQPPSPTIWEGSNGVLG